MKKLFFVLCSALLTGALFSCNFTEDLYLKEDGSGKISINFDGSQLMEMAGDEMMKKEEKAMDSIISFKEFLEEKKDSIANLPESEQAKLKRLENFKMHMLMNPEKKEMKFELFTQFNSVDELTDLFASMKDAGALQQGASAAPDGPLNESGEATDVAYSFKGNSFSRVTSILDEELLKQTVDSLDQMKMFLAGSTYTLRYHFPKKIKSISLEKALLGQDGKSFELEVDFLEYMKNPKVLDVEVELED